MYDKEKVLELKRRNLTIFEEVYQIRLEIVMGCNLNCEFCGRTRVERNYMSKDTFFKTFEGATKRLKRIELTGQGEPTLHPDLPVFVSYLRTRFIDSQILVYTNCEKYKKDHDFKPILNLFKQGLNLLQVDAYNQETWTWIQWNVLTYAKELEELGVKVFDFYKDQVNPWAFKGIDNKMLIIADETKGFNYYAQTTRNAHTFGGNLSYDQWEKYTGTKIKDYPMSKPCAEPLKYMTIGWNGDVYLCCTDGAKAIVIDNIHDKNINEIWQSEDFQKLRLALKVKRRDLIPCCVLCNVNSVRSGLYGYWGNKYSLSEIIDGIYNCTVPVSAKEPLINNLNALGDIKELNKNIEDFIHSSNRNS